MNSSLLVVFRQMHSALAFLFCFMQLGLCIFSFCISLQFSSQERTFAERNSDFCLILLCLSSTIRSHRNEECYFLKRICSSSKMVFEIVPTVVNFRIVRDCSDEMIFMNPITFRHPKEYDWKGDVSRYNVSLNYCRVIVWIIPRILRHVRLFERMHRC